MYVNKRDVNKERLIKLKRAARESGRDNRSEGQRRQGDKRWRRKERDKAGEERRDEW